MARDGFPQQNVSEYGNRRNVVSPITGNFVPALLWAINFYVIYFVN
jgi:hypothetical protein